MKRTISLIIVLLLFVSMLASCSSTPTTAAAPTDGETSTTTAAAPAKEVTINFPCIWVAKDSKATGFGEMVKSFNEENAGKIKVVIEEQTDYQMYRDKIRTSITSGSTPDMFSYDTTSDMTLFADSGKLMDLTTYLADGWSDSFASGSLEKAQTNGKNYMIPFEMAVTPVLYNSKLLAEVGYDSFPTTYDEMFVMADKLKAKDIIPFSMMTGENAWTTMLWYSQVLVAIGGPDVYERGFDDPAFVEAAKIIKKMFDYTSSDAVGGGAAVAAGHFLNERSAILMNGPWFIGRIKKEGINNLYDNIKIAPAPVLTGGKGQEGGYIGVVQAYLGAAKTDDPAKEAAVVAFLKYITDTTRVADLSASSGSLFFVKTAESDKTERLQAEMIKQSGAAPYIVSHFQNAVGSSVAQQFPSAISSLVTGDATPEEFVEMLKMAADK